MNTIKDLIHEEVAQWLQFVVNIANDANLAHRLLGDLARTPVSGGRVGIYGGALIIETGLETPEERALCVRLLEMSGETSVRKWRSSDGCMVAAFALRDPRTHEALHVMVKRRPNEPIFPMQVATLAREEVTV